MSVYPMKDDKMTVASNYRGFTLMETMVATMVLGIALVAIMELFSGGLRSARLAEDHTHAVLLAENQLEEILLTTPLKETKLEGIFDDQFNWSCEIKPDEKEQMPLDLNPLMQAFYIQFTVHWQTGNKKNDFTLNTIRITKPAPEQETI